MPIVTDGLIAYWHWNQGLNVPTWTNIAPGATKFNATFFNGAGTQVDPLQGPYFDGVDDYAATSEPFPWLSNYTIEVMYTCRKVNAGNPQQIVELNGQYDSYTYFALNDVNQLEFVSASAGYYLYLNSTTTDVYEGEPYHLVGSYGAAESVMRFYINGMLDISDSSSADLSQFGQMYIGTSWEGVPAYPATENISIVRVYNRVLTDAEVQQNYEAGLEIGVGPPGALTATLFLVGAAFATITKSRGLDAQVNAGSSASAAAFRTIALAATLNAGSSVLAAVHRKRELAGAAGYTFSPVVANLYLPKPLSSDGYVETNVIGFLSVPIIVAGQAEASTNGIASVTRTMPVSANVNGAADFSGSVTRIPDVAGSASAVSDSTAIISRAASLAGNVEAVSDGSASDVFRLRALNGTVDALTANTADLRGRAMLGSVDLASNVTGELHRFYFFEGTVTAEATGEATEDSHELLNGKANMDAAVTGNLIKPIFMRGLTNANSANIAAASRVYTFSGQANGSASVTATIQNTIDLSGQFHADCSVFAWFLQDITLFASSSSDCAILAVLGRYTVIRGSAGAASTASHDAVLERFVALRGSAAAVADNIARLTKRAFTSGSLAATTDASGTIINTSMKGDSAADSTASADVAINRALEVQIDAELDAAQVVAIFITRPLESVVGNTLIISADLRPAIWIRQPHPGPGWRDVTKPIPGWVDVKKPTPGWHR